MFLAFRLAAIVVGLSTVSASSVAQAPADINIIPQPVSIKVKEGSFKLNEAIRVVTEGDSLDGCAAWLNHSWTTIYQANIGMDKSDKKRIVLQNLTGKK